MSEIKAQSVTLEGSIKAAEHSLIGKIDLQGVLEGKISKTVERIEVAPAECGKIIYTQDKTIIVC